MTDFRDPMAEERLAFEHPDEHLRRREFLQRTAMTAGLAASMATVLDPTTLVAEAARRQTRKALPSPRNLPIDTFVVLMMENRSFDHYLGWLPGADGRTAGLSYEDRQGNPVETRRFAPDFQGCAHPDPDHGFKDCRTHINGGKMDGFLKSKDNDEFAVGYYLREDLPFIGHAAVGSTAFDRFFCSHAGSTFPNREYMWAAQDYGHESNVIPTDTSGNPDNTIMDACDANGVSARYFFNDLPVSALWGDKGISPNRSGRVEEYYTRAAAGTLPNVTYVDPQFLNEGGGTSADDHPHGDIRAGQAFVSDVAHAFMESPQFKRGALFIVYDEWGGFFDHVPPPRVPDPRNSRNVDKDHGQMGIRIPAVMISPYAKRGFVSHTTFGFESILKMIEYRYGLKPLTRRDRYANNIARAFDWESDPKPPPQLPKAPDFISQQCSNRAPSALSRPSSRDSMEAKQAAAREKPPERPAQHDLEMLLSSGYLERLGFEYKPASASSTFREPHTVTEMLSR
ncbi:MAG: phospholipase [Thermoleophilaceae bacterium]|nr:phospholipase [Thermoleophilaceae bacterium]